MVVIPPRKYRGPLRLAPLRAAAVDGLRRYHDEDAPDPHELELAMRRAGFVGPARHLRDALDAKTGTVRCKACGEPLGAGGPLISRFHRARCDVCYEHNRRKRVIKDMGKRKAKRFLDPRVPRQGTFQRDNSRWPWVCRNDGTYVIQKSWQHLAGKIPEYEAYFRMAEDQRRAVNRLIDEELRKRRLG